MAAQQLFGKEGDGDLERRTTTNELNENREQRNSNSNRSSLIPIRVLKNSDLGRTNAFTGTSVFPSQSDSDRSPSSKYEEAWCHC